MGMLGHGVPPSYLEYSSVEMEDSGLLGVGVFYINFVQFQPVPGEMTSQGFPSGFLLLLLLFNSSEAMSSLNKMSHITVFFPENLHTLGWALGIISPNFIRGFLGVSLRVHQGVFQS